MMRNYQFFPVCQDDCAKLQCKESCRKDGETQKNYYSHAHIAKEIQNVGTFFSTLAFGIDVFTKTRLCQH